MQTAQDTTFQVSLTEFDELSRLLALEPAAFHQELDSLRAEARGLEGKPAAQRALLLVVETLEALKKAGQG